MNIIKTILTIFFLAFAFSASAQKVKVKKGVVYIDKKESTIRIERNDTIYKLSEVSSEQPFITVVYYSKNTSDNARYQWLEIINPINDSKNVVDMEYVTFTVNMEKAITQYVMKRLFFFDATGTVDQEKIDAFFKTKTESPKKQKYLKKINKENGDKAALAEIATLNFNVDLNTRRIFKGNIPYKVISGRDPGADMDTIPNMIGVYNIVDENTVYIGDLEGRRIATVTKVNPYPDGSMPRENIKVVSEGFDKRFKYKTTYTFSHNSTSGNTRNFTVSNTKKFIIEVVQRLYLNGVTLGSQVSDIRNEQYNTAKANSPNIYEKKGYVIDDEGKKWEGDIYMLFEEIKDPNDPFSGSGMVDLTSYGTDVTIRYTNEKGKKKQKRFSAKKGNRFCIVNEEGSETCFQGITIKSNGFLASAVASAVGVSANQFSKEVFKEGKVTIYQDVLYNKIYYIKTETQKKAFNFQFGTIVKETKKIAKLTEYLNGCDVTNGKYDEKGFESIENIKELINFYNNSCN